LVCNGIVSLFYRLHMLQNCYIFIIAHVAFISQLF